MKKYIPLFAAVALLFSGCSEKEQPVPVDNSSIDLSELSVVAGPEGGEYTVNVTSAPQTAALLFTYQVGCKV